MEPEDVEGMEDGEFLKLCESMLEMNRIILSKEDFDKFLEEIENPSPPNEALNRLMQDFIDECTQNTDGDD